MLLDYTFHSSAIAATAGAGTVIITLHSGNRF